MELETVNIKLPSKIYSIEWNGINFYIENVNGNLNVMFDSDIHIGINGEMGIVSTNNIHFDTIGSKLYLNSRKSKSLKDLPESIAYREKQDQFNKKQHLMMAEEHETLIQRIEDLERIVKLLSAQGGKLTKNTNNE